MRDSLPARPAGPPPAAADPARRGWLIVVPAKRLRDAKTRLRLPAPQRRELALAMACDTLAAALSCPEVAAVWVVTADDEISRAAQSLGAAVVAEPEGPPQSRPVSASAGLNSAVSAGTGLAAASGFARIAVLVADLPAAKTAELTAVLRSAGSGGLLVPDADGAGTTLLCLPASSRPEPTRYGPHSASAHLAAGFPALAGEVAGRIPGLRRDVDTLASLREAAALGVGARTAELLRRETDLLG